VRGSVKTGGNGLYHTRRVRRSTLLFCTLVAAYAVVARSADSEDTRGPDVTIIAQEERTIFEYRQAGQLRMVKIVPKLGRPYYLVPADETRGFGDLEQAGMLIPRWVIVEF
jgi:Protein of unknown function (DUF2782)